MANPLDLLQDKNNTWQDIATAWFNKGRQNKRKALLASAFLGWMGARENRMIRDTNLKLGALERERIAQKSKITEQHRRANLIFDDLDQWDQDSNYFKLQASKKFDEDPNNVNYWENVGSGLGRKSKLANRLREEKIDLRAKGLENQMWAKLGYTANKDGIFVIDPATRRPYQKDDPLTKDYIEEYTPEQLSKVRYRQTEDENLLPFNQYYDKRIEGLLRPENISWAGKLVNRLGFGKKAALAFEEDLETLKTLKDEQLVANSNISSPFIRITNIEGRPVTTIDGHSSFKPLKVSDIGSLKIGKAEAIQRIMYAPELSGAVELKQNAIQEVTKMFKGPIQEISIDELSLKIADTFSGYNAEMEKNANLLEAFEQSYVKVEATSFVEAGITGEEKKGLDWNSVKNAKFQLVNGKNKLINPVTNAAYTDEIEEVRNRYIEDISFKSKELIGMDTSVEKLLYQVRDLNEYISDPDVDKDNDVYKAAMAQLIEYTLDDFTKSELSLADSVLINPIYRAEKEGELLNKGVIVMDKEMDDGSIQAYEAVDYADFSNVYRMNALKRGKRTYLWIQENY